MASSSSTALSWDAVMLALRRSLGSERRRIVVAMSGGVDSSVVAALAARAGHEVIGITLQLYDNDAANSSQGAGAGRSRQCCAGQDIHDARRVADTLAIPHYVLDYERAFAERVIAPFAASYAAGETPIPCIACNQHIKFGPLLDTARDLGGDVMATGHYVRSVQGPDGPELYRAVDASRDQSYFLFATTREQLARLAFPLGEFPKALVRELARDLDLPIAAKPDSQDICFVPTGGYAATVRRLRPDAAEPGDIVDGEGRVLGRHAGIMNFTVGQRRGLGIAAAEPLFVVAIDAALRQVVVGPRERLESRRLTLTGLNWLAHRPICIGCEPRSVWARIRSTGKPVAASIGNEDAGGRVRVVLRDGEFGVSAGQACVLYDGAGDGARVLGGGWIAETQAEVGSRHTAAAGGAASVSSPVSGRRPVLMGGEPG